MSVTRVWWGLMQVTDSRSSYILKTNSEFSTYSRRYISGETTEISFWPVENMSHPIASECINHAKFSQSPRFPLSNPFQETKHHGYNNFNSGKEERCMQVYCNFYFLCAGFMILRETQNHSHKMSLLARTFGITYVCIFWNGQVFFTGPDWLSNILDSHNAFYSN